MFSALPESFRPFAEARHGKTELAEECGIPKNHGMPVYRRDNARDRRLVKSINISNVKVAKGSVKMTAEAGGRSGAIAALTKR